MEATIALLRKLAANADIDDHEQQMINELNREQILAAVGYLVLEQKGFSPSGTQLNTPEDLWIICGALFDNTELPASDPNGPQPMEQEEEEQEHNLAPTPTLTTFDVATFVGSLLQQCPLPVQVAIETPTAASNAETSDYVRSILPHVSSIAKKPTFRKLMLLGLYVHTVLNFLYRDWSVINKQLGVKKAQTHRTVKKAQALFETLFVGARMHRLRYFRSTDVKMINTMCNNAEEIAEHLAKNPEQSAADWTAPLPDPLSYPTQDRNGAARPWYDPTWWT
jgi:hypothetical protein